MRHSLSLMQQDLSHSFLHRGFMAVRLLLTRICKHSCVVIFLDGLQWGDAESDAGLLKVLRGPDSPPLLFAGTCRSDELAASRFLRAWERIIQRDNLEIPTRDVGLVPLSEQQCTQLVIQELGRDTEVIPRTAQEFARKTGANPYLLIELIGCFDPQTGSIEALLLPQVARRKLDRLPTEACRLLKLISKAGKAGPS